MWGELYTFPTLYRQQCSVCGAAVPSRECTAAVPPRPSPSPASEMSPTRTDSYETSWILAPSTYTVTGWSEGRNKTGPCSLRLLPRNWIRFRHKFCQDSLNPKSYGHIKIKVFLQVFNIWKTHLHWSLMPCYQQLKKQASSHNNNYYTHDIYNIHKCENSIVCVIGNDILSELLPSPLFHDAL